MVDRRALPGFGAGLAGLASGVASLVFGRPVLGLAAGVFALGAGAATLVAVRGLGQTEADLVGATALARLLEARGAGRDEGQTLIDEETGLADGRFFGLAIDQGVATARRRLWPVSVVLLDVGLRPECRAGRARVQALTEFATLLRGTLRQADVACRTSETGFSLVLEDTAEEGGVWVAERVQIAMAQEGTGAHRLVAGIATYPMHGLDADQVLTRAQAALTRARSTGAGTGLGQVEVAQPDFA